jgi:putative MATE family efflux protein
MARWADLSGALRVESAAGSHGRKQALAERTRLILEGPVLLTLLRLSAPNVLNLLAITGLVAFDGLILSGLGEEALAGAALAFPFVMFVQHAAASGLGGAVSSAVARSIGAGDRTQAERFAVNAFWLALLSGLAVSVSMRMGGRSLYSAMGATGATLEAAVTYSDAAFAGITAVFMLNLLANAIRGSGHMGLPAAVLLAAVTTHICLAPALVFGFGPMPALGLVGAGWSLALAFGAWSLVLIARLRRASSTIGLPLEHLRPSWTFTKELLRVGVPGTINVGMTNLGVVLVTAVMSRLSPDAALGYAVASRIEYVLIPIAFGFGTAILAMVGTCVGARKMDRARRVAWTGSAVVGVACASVGLYFAVWPEQWLRWFALNAAATESAAQYLKMVGGVYGLYGAGMALYSAMQGAGSPMPVVLCTIMRVTIAVAGAWVAIVWLSLGGVGAYAAVATAFAAYGVIVLVVVRRALGRRA